MGDLFFFFWLNTGKIWFSFAPQKGFFSSNPFQLWSSSTFMKRLPINQLIILSSEHQIFPGSMNYCYNQTNWRSSKLLCLGFGWDRVNLLPSSLYSIYCIYYENNVDNTSMTQVLLSNAYTKLRTSVSHAALPASGGGGANPWDSVKRQSWAAFPDWPKDIPYHRTTCELGGKLAGGKLGIGQLLVSAYFSFASLVFLSSYLLFIYLFVIFLFIRIHYYYFISIIKLSLSQHICFSTFTLPIFSLIPPGQESSCVMLSCWFMLNHDTSIPVVNRVNI